MHIFDTKIDFYITNVCNLTCNGCNRFNNHSFKGWQDWKDYAEVYEQWGKLVQLKSVTIMGGEPFLNPTLVDWVAGINRIFDVEVQILTNGTRFKNAPPGLYDTLARYTSKRTGAKNHIGVSLHIPDKEEETIDAIHSFLGTGTTIVNTNQNPWKADYLLVSKHGVIVTAFRSTQFTDSAIISLVPDRKTSKPRFTLHDSIPVRAHANCSFVNFKSYHFIKGALYKCAPAALLKEFDQQHPFEIADWRRQIIHHGYTPLTVNNFHSQLPTWLAELDNPIPNCQLCPNNDEAMHPIFPVHKKSLSHK